MSKIGRFEALILAHEIDGALDVLARTRGLRPWFAQGISDDDLLDRMENASAPPARRLAAPNLLASMPPEDSVRRLFALVRDAATPRELRAAVIDQLARYAGVSGTEPTWPRRRTALARELTTLVREGLARETDDAVRVALVDAAGRWELRIAVPRERSVAMSAVLDGTRVRYRGASLPAAIVENRGVELLRSDGSLCPASVEESTAGQLFWSGTLDASRCPDADRVRMQLGGRRLIVWIRR